jgi:hypothetical protein
MGALNLDIVGICFLSPVNHSDTERLLEVDPEFQVGVIAVGILSVPLLLKLIVCP